MTPLTDAQWTKVVRPGSKVYLGGGAACPLALKDAILKHAQEIGDLTLIHEMPLGPALWASPRLENILRVILPGPDDRPEESGPQVEHTPCGRWQVADMLHQGMPGVDVALISVCPPDEQGFCSMGPGIGAALAACDSAKVIVAQINENIPRVPGQSYIHSSRINFCVEALQDLAELPPGEPIQPIMRRIGEYAAQIVADGSTIQAGLGPAVEATLAALAKHRHLGLHTIVMGDAHMRLIQSGAVDNSRKATDRGVSVASWLLGSKELYKFAANNPHLSIQPGEYVAHPSTLLRQHKLVSINPATAVDTAGRVLVEPNPYGMPGAAEPDFMRRTALGADGISIVVMPSTIGEGPLRRSRIFSRIGFEGNPGAMYVEAQHIVTEYGMANIRASSLRERTMEIIEIAHPDFREELLEQAREDGLLPSYYRLPPPRPNEEQTNASRGMILKDGRRYVMRPLRPGDEQRLQSFFYTHDEETIQRRYGYAVTRMSQQRAFEGACVDQTRDLALALFDMEQARPVIRAVGRFYLDKKGRAAEMAFVVDQRCRRAGMARALLDEMIVVAANRGLKRLWAQVDRDNIPMIKLFQQYPASMEPGDEPNTMRVILELGGQQPPEEPRYSILQRVKDK
ncbi:MAG: GNAT family N-acetyltransferase [Opitutales bacterium]|jgi:acyl-CoA hydrolase/ribosomal protein S18 acetylase RimI-like enzyme